MGREAEPVPLLAQGLSISPTQTAPPCTAPGNCKLWPGRCLAVPPGKGSIRHSPPPRPPGPHCGTKGSYKRAPGGEGTPGTCTMKPAGALLLLGAALLLILGGNCDICPAVKDDVNRFLVGTPEEYIATVRQYNSDSLIEANARKLKSCVDGKLTEEDKQNALNALVGPADKIYTDPLC
nr:major allergen I polypeptide chain 1-like isoform X3 [Vicugna pacos]